MTERDLFLAALRQPGPADRAAILERAAAGDADLRDRVAALLAEHDQLGSFLEQPAVGPAGGATAPGEAAGTVIGPYTLLELIGEGGFGVVFRAEQQEPVRRTVALKVLKAGMDTRQVVARFDAERQALALMDHPHIARALDAGVTGDGRPYFVMELVPGTPVTDYCDDHHLAPRERLDLFVQVCRAVQHAHQKGVIHRDLKPSNVLVSAHDGVPAVKVIDFGVAKAVGQVLTDKTLVTGPAQLVGTPLYMSPEQAGHGPDVDTRSDIYSLGVLLYELLTGATPFARERFRDAGYDEIRRIIREEEPAKPSTRLSTLGRAAETVSANRASEPDRLTKLVKGELDWIVMKCLEKDRSRRYESAAALMADVERYLADEPVLAGPPTAGYRVRKFLRRNRRAAAVGATAAASLLVAVAGVAGSVGWAARDRAERAAAADREHQARDAEREREIGRILDEAEGHRDRRDWARVGTSLDRAGWLRAQGASDASGRRIDALGNDLRMAVRLEELSVEDPRIPFYNVLDRAALDPRYAEAFKDYGIDVPALDPGTAADHLRASAIGPVLVAALDDWMWIKLCKLYNAKFQQFLPDVQTRERRLRAEYDHLRAVADLADPDDLGRRLRDPQVQADVKVLQELAARPDVRGRPSAALFLARLLHLKHATRPALGLLFAVHEQDPADFLVNYSLAMLLSFDKARLPEAIGYLRAAIAVRPQYPSLRRKLGDLMRQAERPVEKRPRPGNP